MNLRRITYDVGGTVASDTEDERRRKILAEEEAAAARELEANKTTSTSESSETPRVPLAVISTDRSNFKDDMEKQLAAKAVTSLGSAGATRPIIQERLPIPDVVHSAHMEADNPVRDGDSPSALGKRL